MQIRSSDPLALLFGFGSRSVLGPSWIQFRIIGEKFNGGK